MLSLCVLSVEVSSECVCVCVYRCVLSAGVASESMYVCVHRWVCLLVCVCAFVGACVCTCVFCQRVRLVSVCVFVLNVPHSRTQPEKKRERIQRKRESQRGGETVKEGQDREMKEISKTDRKKKGRGRKEKKRGEGVKQGRKTER